MGVLLAPVMVVVKYLTGWSIVAEPSWIPVARPALEPLLALGTPVELWVIYGTLYTAALLLMLAGFAALLAEIRAEAGSVRPRSLWILLAGLVLVIGGDAVHTHTWHQDGLTVPTPGTNPVANTGYAVHMMGMNFILIGSLAAGIGSLRRRLLPRWLGWLLALIAPSAVILSMTVLPTTPSGGLLLFSATMAALGAAMAAGRGGLTAA